MATFTHEPRAPEVPAEAAHRAQRYFTGSDTERWVADTVRVMRFAHDQSAQVEMRTRYGKSRAELIAYLTADELREFAARLIDAAHDLDTHAAEELAA